MRHIFAGLCLLNIATIESSEDKKSIEAQLIEKNIKIFQLSNGCTGTGSLRDYFSKFISSDKVFYSDCRMTENFKKNASIFDGLSPELLYFGDLKLGEDRHTPQPMGCNIVKEMHQTFPNSVFVLNQRPLSQWLKSIIYGFYSKEFKKEHEKVALRLIGMHFKYNCCVKNYFQEQGANNLIIWDMEKDDFEDFQTQFFNISGIRLRGKLGKSHHHADHSFQNENEPSGAVLLDNMCEFWIY